MAVKVDKIHEVLGIFNRPRESAAGWLDIFLTLQTCGVKDIGLMVADRMKALEDASADAFPGTSLQE